MPPTEPEQPEPSDEEIATLADASFDVLVADYRRMLLNYLKGLVGDAHLAEDLTQETFLAAHRAIGKFDAGAGSFGAWLRGIARNKVRDNHRASARRPLLVDSRVVDGMEEVYSLFDSPSEQGGGWADRLEILRGCVAKLKGALRPAIEAVYARGLSLKEAAADLGSSVEAIGQRLTRGRRLVRECVMRSQGNPDDRNHDG